MSYALFLKGYTAEEISKMHKPTPDELAAERMRKWRESEHVLNTLRIIKASTQIMNRLEKEAWAEVHKRHR